MMDIDKIEQLVKLTKESMIAELTVRRNGVTISIRKGAEPLIMASPAPIQEQVSSKAKGKSQKQQLAKDTSEPKPLEGSIIPAPMVGIFHAADGVTLVGTSVQTGQTIGSIESMRLVNAITSPVDGLLAEVLVEDGTPVEYGQPLFRLVNC